MQSIVIPGFRSKNKKSFVLNLDLMELKSEEDFSKRVKKAFERAFSESFPAKNLWNKATEFIGNLRPTIEIDPITTQTSISISSSSGNKVIDWQDIFDTILESIVPQMKTLIVMDEFQDIAFVEGLQGSMRTILQKFKNTPVILLGSKRHLLTQIFSQPSAPLANFGEDLEFQAIPYEEFHEYIQERFKERGIRLSFELSKELQDKLLRVPEAINIVCDTLLQRFQNVTLTREMILLSLISVIDSRKSRFESYLSFFSENEQEILIAIQKSGVVKQSNGKEFLKQVSLTGKSVRVIVKYLHDHSIVKLDDRGYSIADPLFGVFLARYR